MSDPLHEIKIADPGLTPVTAAADDESSLTSSLLMSLGILVAAFIVHRVNEHTDAVLSLHRRLTILEAQGAAS